MSVTLSPLAGAGWQFFNNNGQPLAGGLLYTYSAGTSTQAVTYTSVSGAIANSNPIVLDSAGRVPNEVWISVGLAYKFVLQDASGNQIASYDNIPGNGASSFANDANAIAYEPGYTVTAGSFVVGQSYLISTIGTTNFVAIGAASNTVGTYFTATGAGSGTGTAQLSTTVQAKLRQTVSVLDFIPSTVNPATTDVSTYINTAISTVNAAGGGTVIIPNGTYLVGANTISGIGTGIAGIVLLNNVHLVINGTVKVANGIYGSGAFYGAIRSLDSGLSNASITGTGTVDGNKANQTSSTQCSNIYLTCSFNVTVDGIYSVNSNGMGIQLVPVSGSTHSACAVQNCFINSVTNIGIQVSHALYCNISNNRITTCANNGIDIYGDNGTAAADDGIISINGNTIGGTLAGVFVETSTRTSVVGNAIDGSSVGIATNRVNGQPYAITVSGNTISNCPTGMFDSGDTGGILVSNNYFSSFTTAGLQIGYSGGNISYVNAYGNVFSPSTTTSPLIYVTGVQASFNIVRQNYCTDGSHNAAYLIVVDASSSVNNTLEYPMIDTTVQPVRQVVGGTSASGGTATITVKSGTAGKLVIKSSSGGSNYSVWSGSFVASGTGTAVTQDSTTFVAGQNNISSVAASTSTFVITITFATTGAAGTWNAWLDYF